MSPWADRSIFAKIFTVLALAFLLGIGLCGVDAFFLASFRNVHEEFSPNTFVGGIGLIALLLSAFGLAGTTVVWVVVRVVAGIRGEPSEQERLSDRSDEDDHPEE